MVTQSGIRINNSKWSEAGSSEACRETKTLHTSSVSLIHKSYAPLPIFWDEIIPFHSLLDIFAFGEGYEGVRKRDLKGLIYFWRRKQRWDSLVLRTVIQFQKHLLDWPLWVYLQGSLQIMITAWILSHDISLGRNKPLGADLGVCFTVSQGRGGQGRGRGYRWGGLGVSLGSFNCSPRCVTAS